MNHRVYDPILAGHENAKFIPLDDYYKNMTFLQAGEYKYKVKDKTMASNVSGTAMTNTSNGRK